MGRLATAQRADNSQILVSEQFAYDGDGDRVRTTRSDTLTGQVDHTLQIFDSLVLLHAAFPGAAGDYERDPKTEHLYLNGGGMLLGHVLYDETETLPQAAEGNGLVHVFMPLGDSLGSTCFVVDHDSGELVEAMNYQPYGAVESDYRPQEPERWNAFREDVRYTGHWDDSQVGLIYFGARYYAPTIARWISPDPLAIHGFAGDPNPYAFVHGSPIGNVDPYGLDDTPQPTPQGPSVSISLDSIASDIGAAISAVGSGISAIGRAIGGALSAIGNSAAASSNVSPDQQGTRAEAAAATAVAGAAAEARSIQGTGASSASSPSSSPVGQWIAGPFQPGGGLHGLAEQLQPGMDQAANRPFAFVAVELGREQLELPGANEATNPGHARERARPWLLPLKKGTRIVLNEQQALDRLV